MGMLLNDVMVSVPPSAKSTPMTVQFFVRFGVSAERRAAALRRKCNVLTSSDKTPEAITDRGNQVKMEEPTPFLGNHWLVQSEKQ